MDLPRFHSGSLGPLDFQTLNEVMDRLDTLMPVIESLRVENKQPTRSLEKVMLVMATPSTGGDDVAGKFDWEEVMVRGPSTAEDQPEDGLIVPGQEDYEEEREQNKLRSGRAYSEVEKGGVAEPLDTYAVSVAPFFEGGLAICFALRRTDGTKRYVLSPVPEAPGEPGGGTGSIVKLVRTTGPGGNSSFPVASEDVNCFIYPVEIYDFTTGGFVVDRQGVLLDFSSVTENIPSHNTSATLGPAEPLEENSFVIAIRGSGSVYYTSNLPRLSIDC